MGERFSVVEFPGTYLIGLAADFYGGMSPKFNGPEVLGPLWGLVHSKIGAIDESLRLAGRMIAATRPADSGEEGLLNQFVGLEVAQLPSDLNGLDILELPAMRLATYEHYGSMRGLVASIKELYGEILPASGFKQPTPWSLELEIYDERFNMQSDESVMTIATPILAD
jgi:predicted transcriptional regulator YdeE